MLPAHLQALADLCAAHPTARKVIFAPSAQGGRAAADALARAGVASLALDLTTPEIHAAEHLPPARLAAGARPPAFFSEPVLLAALAADLPDDAPLRAVGVSSLRDRVDALRLAGPLDPGSTLDLDDGHRTDQLRALAQHYDAALGDRLDAAATLIAATQHVEAHGPPPGTVYAAFDETDLGPLAAHFLRALTDGGRTLHRVGFDLPGAAVPVRTAAGHFWADHDAPPPPSVGAGARLAIGGGAGEGLHFRTAVGAQAEVRDALRDVLDRGLAFDTVEVAYVAADPYLALLHSERDLRPDAEPLPVTFGAGVPITSTRTGQALRGLLDWLEQGRDAATVVRLLQGGLLTLESDTAHAAHALLRGGLGRGPGALDRALVTAARALGERDDDWSVAERGRLDALAPILSRLDALFPDACVTPAAFASALRQALHLFGPDANATHQDGNLSHSQLAHHLLARRLDRFADDPPTDHPATPADHARAFRDAALNANVDSRDPRPGHLHVVPLSSAGLSGRPHLVVVGLDAASAAPSSTESALLPDREAERLDPAGAALPTVQATADASVWFAARALGRIPPPTTQAPTSVTFCQRTLDLGSGAALAPSGLMLRAAALAGHDALDAEGPALNNDGANVPWPLATLAPDAAPLHVHESDLARRPNLTGRFLAAAYGLAGAYARAAEAVTLHDGWLGPDHPGLPLAADGHALSSSRLEALRACPLGHFAGSVLGARAAPEPPQSDGGLSPKDRGSLLHGLFEAYGRILERDDRPPTLADEPLLLALADEHLDDWIRSHGALDDAPAVRADLRATAGVFLRSEVHYGAGAVPAASEFSFGMDEPVPVRLADDLTVPLRGFIDRVDRLPDGTYAVADFKTGSTYGFPDPSDPDPLQSGKLQWALYALALEDATADRPDGPWRVTRSGYRFPTTRAGGEWRAWSVPSRDAVADAVRPLFALASAGLFAPRPNGSGCRYCDVARACGDLKRRKTEINASTAAATDNAPLSVAIAHLDAL